MAAADIGPGDWVECIDVSPQAGWPPGTIRAASYLMLGGLYQVERVGPSVHRLATGPVSLWLREFRDLPGYAGNNPDRFRPVHSRRRSADLIARLLQPVGVS